MQNYSKKSKDGDNLEDLDLNQIIILKWIFKKEVREYRLN